ncbi:unnamed protein product [Cladocopium goreaui]|uniref:Uncharacterized protein n=1 Tax=Cladocopium goreaui TaxID=2562237 RepID=A0A9P1DCI5_9DINO|nr:unnamed protein product [Cladocopium goreaui]
MPKSKKEPGAVVSKQWSCSELVDGNNALLKAKREKDSPASLQKKIQEYEAELEKLRNSASPDDETQPASETEVHTRKTKKQGEKPVNATGATTPLPSHSSRTTETPQSPPDPPGGSGNPAALKRLRGKGSDPDKDRQIEELRKAGLKMQLEMEKLKQQIDDKKNAGSSKEAFTPKESDRMTAAKTLPKPKNPPKPVEVSEPGLPAPASEAAKRARLRRLCERKPSGRIFVPEEVHSKWKNASSDERDAMVEILEANNWSKEVFVSKVTKSIQKTSKLSRRKKRGWYTEETMATVLKWSKKDRYNKKLNKFYVVYEEGDENLSEDEEIERQDDVQEPTAEVNFSRVGKGMRTRAPEPTVSESESEDDDEKESKADQSNSAEKELERFKSFGSSLLSKEAKLQDLVTDLEQALEELGLREKIENQTQSTTVACSKVTTSESSAKNILKSLRKLITAKEECPGLRLLPHYAKLIAGGARGPKVMASQCTDLHDLGATFAPCSHVVELARAEVQTNPNADQRLRVFAGIRIADAEVGCHQVFQRYGLSAAVEIEKLELFGMKDFPYIPFSTWAQYLLDTNRFTRQLCGCRDFNTMRSVLTEFWSRYHALFPNHEIFSKADAGEVALERTVPFFSHTDEGRSQKHDPLWVLSCHGALGRGTRLYLKMRKHRKAVGQNEMGLNFVGQTWSTQFLLATVLKRKVEDFDTSLELLLRKFSEDCSNLATRGLSHEGQTIWLLHLGTKGDLPALNKESNPRTGAADVPYEDLGENPIWEGTMHSVEDFIGRPSRVSRRVDIRRVHRNVMLRCLILSEQALQKSDDDDRGMDAYM